MPEKGEKRGGDEVKRAGCRPRVARVVPVRGIGNVKKKEKRKCYGSASTTAKSSEA
jgi:hypothetical protein